MKKTIIVAFVAFAMLFAFTACEPQALDYPIAGDNDIANIVVSEAPAFYAGSTDTTGYGTITVERVGGKTTSDVSAKFEIDAAKVLPGVNPVKVTFGENGGKTWTTTIESIELQSIAIESDTYVEGTEVSSADDVVLSSVKGTYTDGHVVPLTIGSTSGVSKTLDKEASAIVVTAKEGVYSKAEVKGTLAVTVKAEEAATPTVATVWTLQVANADGEYADYNASTNKPSINWGETKADILSQIRIVAKTTTTVDEKATVETKILSEGTDYVVQGVASGELKANGTFNVIPLVDTAAEKITFSTTQYSYTVVDAINWEGLTVVWATTPVNCKVGGTLDKTSGATNKDIVVTLKKLSGEAVTSYSVSYIGISSYPETDYEAGDYVTPTVKITVGTESATRTLEQKALGEKTTG